MKFNQDYNQFMGKYFIYINFNLSLETIQNFKPLLTNMAMSVNTLVLLFFFIYW